MALVLKAKTLLFVQLLVLRGYFARYFCSSSVFYIRLLTVLFAVNFVGSSFSTGTASLSKTQVPSFHLSLVVQVCDGEQRGQTPGIIVAILSASKRTS